MAKRKPPVMKVTPNPAKYPASAAGSKPQQKRRSAGKAIRPETDDPAEMLGPLLPNPYQDEGLDDDYDDNGGPDE